MDPGDGRGEVLVAALSEAGQELIYSHGRKAFRQQLIESCIAGSNEAEILAIDWMFVEGSILDAEDRNDQLQALLNSRQRPRFPDVIAQKSSGDSAEYLFDIPAGLTWFDGHFPDDPILPAVVQVDWAIHFAQSLGFDPDRFVGLARLKFKAVIVPGMLVRLSLATSGANLPFVYESAAGLHSKGTVKFLAGRENE